MATPTVHLVVVQFFQESRCSKLGGSPEPVVVGGSGCLFSVVVPGWSLSLPLPSSPLVPPLPLFPFPVFFLVFLVSPPLPSSLPSPLLSLSGGRRGFGAVSFRSFSFVAGGCGWWLVEYRGAQGDRAHVCGPAVDALRGEV